MFTGIKHTANQLLKEDSGTYRRLTHAHSGLTLGAWLVLFILSYLVQFLAPEGGLSNLGTHSLIFTTQVVLLLLGLLLTPFWETGLSYVALDFVRGRRNMSSDLAEGFRCFKPMVGSIAFQCIQYVLIYFVSSSATGFALTLLPFPQAFYEDATTLLQDPSTPLQGRMLIVAVIYAIAFASILIFLSSRIFYRYRMTRFLILDDENTGGMKAAMESRNLMKGNKKHLFRLDLSFWWFYLPELLGTVLPITALMISGLQVSLPAHWETALWAMAAFSLALRLVVHFFGKPKTAAAYALFYDRLLKQKEEPTVTVEDGPSQQSPPKKPQPPGKVPWKY